MDFNDYLRDIQDFPKQGIVFKDITPLLQDKNALKEAAEALYRLVGNHRIDKVVGMESRGFFFGPMLADKLNAGFVPVRKSGKLPAEKLSQSYNLEYGTDILEIHKDSINKGENVLIHDDVLATGGTAKAVCQLVDRLGGNIIACNFLIELDFLNGRQKLEGREIQSLLRY